jgi:hypothetical protein
MCPEKLSNYVGEVDNVKLLSYFYVSPAIWEAGHHIALPNDNKPGAASKSISSLL